MRLRRRIARLPLYLLGALAVIVVIGGVIAHRIGDLCEVAYDKILSAATTYDRWARRQGTRPPSHLWLWLMADRDDTLMLLLLSLIICSIGAVGVCV